MKAITKVQNPGTTKTSYRSRSALIFLGLAVALFAVAVSSSAHEPITTKVRFNKEVIRTLQRNCLGCHHPGGIAMSLATYDEARPWAKAIKEEVLEKRMAPWHAVKGYGEFRNAPLLTQRDVDLLVNWIEGGAPKGDDKDLPHDPLFSNDWPLGNPGLVLKPETETKIAADADEFRSFVLPTNLTEDQWLNAIDLQPGNGSVVHCAVFSIVKGESGSPAAQPMTPIKIEESESARRLTVLGTWMPGQRTVGFGEGIGQSLPAGSRINVRIHYHGAGEATTDLSRVGLYFTSGSSASRPRKQIQELLISRPDTAIPVAAEPRPIKLSITVQEDTEAIAIRPTVNPLIVSQQATAYRPDGSEEVLIWTRGYQFDWEPTYYFRQPVSLPKGTRVEVIAYFDNSDYNARNPNDPPKALRWSELTANPLCVLLTASSLATGEASAPR